MTWISYIHIHWFPLPIDASYKIWLWLAKRFQRRRSLKLWTDGRRTDDGRTDGRTADHGHPISSPCEPNGSGELMIATLMHLMTVLIHLMLVAVLMHLLKVVIPMHFMIHVVLDKMNDKNSHFNASDMVNSKCM